MATDEGGKMNERLDDQKETLAHRGISRRTALRLAAGGVAVLAAGQVARAQEDSPATSASASSRLLTPDNCALVLADYQSGVALSVRSIEIELLINNVTGIAEAAAAYGVPTVLTTVLAQAAVDPILPEIQAVFPDQQPIDRFGLNAWDTPAFVEAVAATGRPKLVMAGLFTEICLAQMSLSAIEAGYEVYMLVDVSGGISPVTHDAAVQRLMQAGAVPVTWLAVMSEWQRDYTRAETLPAFAEIGQAHGGPIALGVNLFEARGGGN